LFTEDILIDFSSKSDHACTTSLFDLPDEDDLKPWPSAIITGETVFSARIGPTGGKRGYTPITGKVSISDSKIGNRISNIVPQHHILCRHVLQVSVNTIYV
jgi:hypothetical protein